MRKDGGGSGSFDGAEDRLSDFDRNRGIPTPTACISQDGAHSEFGEIGSRGEGASESVCPMMFKAQVHLGNKRQRTQRLEEYIRRYQAGVVIITDIG